MNPSASTLLPFRRALALLIAMAAALALDRPATAQGIALSVDGAMHGVGRPIQAVVDGGTADQRFDLVLLTAKGAVAGSAEVTPGRRFDLLSALPALGEISAAHWLQLAKNGQPIGTPWVAQPLINRPLVRTAIAMRPDGTTPYTRIIGWGDELLDPDNPEHQKLKPTWTAGDPTPRSGLRLYPDRDVLLETDRGAIRVCLAPDRAPNTAWNFRTLVEAGFYDGTPFHRIVRFDRDGRPFVIQGGDPTGTGDGSAGYDLPLEPSTLPHDFGVISMARGDPPDSAGSQYFFCLSRPGTARLDGQYCAFGWAVQGAPTMIAIAESEIADLATGRPKDPPIVRSAKLVPAPPRTPGRGRPDAPITPAAAAPPVPKGPDR